MSLFSHSFKSVALAAMFTLFLSCGDAVTIEKIVKNPRAYENKRANPCSRAMTN